MIGLGPIASTPTAPAGVSIRSQGRSLDARSWQPRARALDHEHDA